MAATPAQASSVIRFHLNELKARNAHHEFEHLCRHLARARITSNILPATGPVGAGGDHGKDFESFITYVDIEPIADASFARRSSGRRRIAFACSLQERIDAKIRNDIERIVGEGAVDEVVYFCEENLPVGKRHMLQSWAETEHKVDLQIFDGQSIAELLGDHDTVWIAQEYLHLPAELTLQVTDAEDWYLVLLQRWRSREPMPISQADFVELKRGVRHATFTKEARQDLVMWIGKLEKFLEQPTPRRLKRLAIYEIAVASLRGKNELQSQLGRLTDYFSDVQGWWTLSDLQDAATLIQYLFGAFALKVIQLDYDVIAGWRTSVADVLDNHLTEATGPARRAGLLRVRGHISGVPKSLDTPPDQDERFDYWTRMMDEAEKAPLFPIEDFADFLTKITQYLGEHERFEALAQRVDALVERRAGPATAAERAYERALSYYENDDLLRAIRELHQVQKKWFSGDTLYRFQKATLLQAQCYLELRLPFAAKYHALVAAHLAEHADDDNTRSTLPTALFAVADADDAAGASCSYLATMLTAVAAHAHLVRDPFLVESHKSLKANLGQASSLRGLVKRFDSKLLTVVDAVLAFWPEELREGVVESSERPEGYWNHGSDEEIWKGVDEAFLGRPFSDVGPTRIIEWRMLGIDWSVRFSNDYKTTAVVEQFVAQAQIALTCMASCDLVLLSTRVVIDAAVQASHKGYDGCLADTQERDAVSFRVALPDYEPVEFGKMDIGLLAVIMLMLEACSALPEEDFKAAFHDGGWHAASRSFLGRPYAELYRLALPEPLFVTEQRLDATPMRSDAAFALKEHPALSWASGPGPNYSDEVALEAIQSRYRRGLTCVGVTLGKLLASPDHRAYLQRQHREGLKDWEILSIVVSAALNLRFPIHDAADVTEEMKAKYQQGLDTLETAATALAAEQFTEELLDASAHGFRGAFANGWGLQMRAYSPHALEKLLISRYGLRALDVEHPEIFYWPQVTS